MSGMDREKEGDPLDWGGVERGWFQAWGLLTLQTILVTLQVSFVILYAIYVPILGKDTPKWSPTGEAREDEGASCLNRMSFTNEVLRTPCRVSVGVLGWLSGRGRRHSSPSSIAPAPGQPFFRQWYSDPATLPTRGGGARAGSSIRGKP